MTVLEEVKRMQQQGSNDEQIIQSLRERGVEYKEIADSLAQSRIKAAVEQPDTDPNVYPGGTPEPSSDTNMERSIMNQQEPELIPPTPGAGGYAPQQPQGGYTVQQPQDYNTGQYAEGYGQNQQYSASPDLTTEIAEQVVAEKFSEIRKHLEKIADMKSTVEAKMEYLDERLKRIEKIIDTLQSSILRKVGDYVTNVDDIKRELIETQKTFAKLIPAAHKSSEARPKSPNPQHQQHQNHQNQHQNNHPHHHNPPHDKR